MLPRRILGCAKFPAVASWQTREWLLRERGLYSVAVIDIARRGFLVTPEAKRGGDLKHPLRVSSQANGPSASGIRRITNTPRKELTTTATERAVVSDLFLSFGTVDDRGQVTLQPCDLRRMLQSMGVVVSEDKLKMMVSRADKNSTGYISEDDFFEAFDWLIHQTQDERDYAAIFNMLDREKKGFVDVEELTNVHSTTRERLSVEDAKKILKVADKNGDGKMSYEEFLELMTENLIIGWKLLTTFRVIFVMGGPASGKGTICAEVVKRSNSVHVSSGDLLREEVQRRTPLGAQVEEKMRQGKLVDACTVLALLEKFLTLHPGKYVLLDGFPRSLDNARDWTKFFGHPEACIRINCPDEVMFERIVKRGRASGRNDDHMEVAKVRIATYHQQSAGPARYFDSRGIKTVELDGTRPWVKNVENLLELPMLKSICYEHVHEERHRQKQDARTTWEEETA